MINISSITQILQNLLQSIKTVWLNLWQQHRKKTVTTLALLIFTAIAWHNYQQDYAEKLSKAQNFLNIADYPEAKKQFEEAIKANPLYPTAAIVVMMFSDNREQADKLIQEILKVLNLSNSALLGLRKANLFLEQNTGENRHQKITSELKKLKERYPDDADIEALYGKYYLSAGQFENAINSYQRAIKLNPNSADAYAGLCQIFDLGNQLFKAIDNCKQAIAVAKQSMDSAPARYSLNLAKLYQQLDDFGQAQALINDLPANSDTRFELGKIYLFSNQLAQAIELYKETLEKLTPEEKGWYFKTQTNWISLPNLADKKCYLTYLLAVSSYLNNNRKDADNYLKSIAQLCTYRNDDIKSIVRYDLEIAAKNSALTQQAKQFEKRYLKNNPEKFKKLTPIGKIRASK